MRTLSRDTSIEAEAVQIELLRGAGPTRRLALALSLSRSVVELSRQAIARTMPGASDREVMLAWAAVHYGEDLADRVRRYLKDRDG